MRLKSMAKDLFWVAGGLGAGWALIFLYLSRMSRRISVLNERLARLDDIVNGTREGGSSATNSGLESGQRWPSLPVRPATCDERAPRKPLKNAQNRDG